LAIPTPGIPGPSGDYVAFGEYTNPRPFINGFNPSDHVETRVSRLYYYRDAHRVAQIINRDSRSHNRAAVDMHQQLANKARTIADQATDDRRAKEREAVRASQQTREAERELQQAEATAQRAAEEAANANAELQRKDALLSRPSQPLTEQEEQQLKADVQHLPNVIASLESVAQAARRQTQAAYDKVQQLRATEAVATETWQVSIATEDRAREEQFRREVAAAHVDPDTYAPGQPDSNDPVRQVSVSVIGEGLIQLRGPLKGVNMIRTMINQIDAPVGQVRVSVHTVQINGEKGDRMEQVAGKIQRYIDHSRFLTLQSAEMLRKAIVQVAAQRAMELGEVAGMTQEERDRKYLYSFFGEDFIRELEVMDSEFLMTGNKLLSLHSMDSTSLASAMFLMALAKNTTRMQILHTFECMLAGELPSAEQNYFEAGLTCDGKHKLFDKHCKRDDFQLLSANARFQSVRGLFDAEIAADDTMTPIQREFVRLAQIFKSRLIVEMELKQRVMERSIIEERLGDRQKELEEARRKEELANVAKQKAQIAVRDAQKEAKKTVMTLRAALPEVRREVDKAIEEAELAAARVQQLGKAFFHEAFQDAVLLANNRAKDSDPTAARTLGEALAAAQAALMQPLDSEGASTTLGKRLREVRRSVIETSLSLEPPIPGLTKADKEARPELSFTVEFQTGQPPVQVTLPEDSDEVIVDEEGRMLLEAELKRAVREAERLRDTLAKFVFDKPCQEQLDRAKQILIKINTSPESEIEDSLHRTMTVFQILSQLGKYLVQEKLVAIENDVVNVDLALGGDESDLDQAYRCWISAERQFADKTILGTAPAAFQRLAESNLDYQFALREAEAARRPLDHKKFLDMLVDEMEDKFIELLEGTRAHTANIDGYIKRLMTTLDDDFNTQFYYPTFRKVREASQLWDVQMGQVETTNVLANNRAFAKVTPEATMEFDLPKRDIVIAEAIDGAKAMMDDVGALAQDPTFLAMAKLGSGQPTSSQVLGASGGLSTVRNVLPGLSTDTAETVLGQQGPGGAQFGAALEGLIPDPAIYKFETGTGWEIRPVIQPDGQAVVFHFNYMYSTNIREPVRADEKHLGRVKRHFVDTDVQLSNFELREVSRYTVALKASRTSRGVPLLEDIPLAGVLFRPLPSAESSLQQNIIMSQATIFPTLFDLMGLRWAPVVADLDPLRLSNDEFIVRNRRRMLTNRVFDHSSSEVDKFLRVPESERRMDLYRSQETIPGVHPNGYSGPGANLRDSQLQEGYSPTDRPPTQFVPGQSAEGSPLRPQRLLLQPLAAPSLDGPQDGGEAGLEGLEQPLPPSNGQSIESIPAPPADRNSGISPRRATEGGQVSRTSYLQPLSRSTEPYLVSPPPSREAPRLLRQVELRRLPRVDGNIRSN
jgi:hypothetical protein